MFKKYKFILLFILLLFFLFIFDNSVFAIGTASDSNINNTGWRYRNLISDTWDYMLNYLDSNDLNFFDYNYFVTCGTPGNIDRADIFLFPKTNASYILKVSTEGLSYWSNCIHFSGDRSGNWHEEVIGRELRGYLGSNRPTLVVCNDIVTTDDSHTSITRSYKDIDFLTKPVYFDIYLEEPDFLHSSYYVQSNLFDYVEESDIIYECYISEDNVNWNSMSFTTLNLDNGDKFYRFFYGNIKSKVYYFKFLNINTGDYSIITKDFNNISNYPITDVPLPDITYYRDGDKFVLKSQNFLYSDFSDLILKYTSEPLTERLYWDVANVGILYNEVLDLYEYYFYIELPVSSEDITFYFVFYNSNLDKYGSFSSLNCIITNMLDYTDKVQTSVVESNSKLDRIINFWKDRLGFIGDSFELVANFFDRCRNLATVEQEPIIHISEIRDPVNGFVIFNGTEFNFNTLLQNPVFEYLHNLYFIVSDTLIAFFLIKFSLKNVDLNLLD